MAKIRLKIGDNKEIELESSQGNVEFLIKKAMECALRLQSNNYKPE